MIYKDFGNKPLWISSEGQIFMESFTPINKVLQDFLSIIAEPISRPHLIHEYKLTPYSLYAAISVGLSSSDIISILDKLSKGGCPEEIKNWIIASSKTYGKVKIVLKGTSYLLETNSKDIFNELLRDGEISKAVLYKNDEALIIDAGSLKHDSKHEPDIIDEIKFSKKPETYFSFVIEISHVELVKKRCIQLGFPVLEEFEFSLDKCPRGELIQFELRPNIVVRPYQEQALSKVFGNGRARSGIIVLPCGAGKTLVGILASLMIKRSALILCTSTVSAEQWKSQFLQFTNISDMSIARFTSGAKERFKTNVGILVTTYTMIAFTGKRSYEARKVMDFIGNKEWGLIILDEVHVVPANVFRKVLSTVAAQVKIGLTATLVREDEKIEDLNFLIGPKLYEANWQDLSRQGHIANVQCAEVWCEMPSHFYRQYLNDTSKKRKLTYIMNPKKFQTCQYLIDFHERRGDKIIVFSDNVYALKAYALKLNKPFIYGPTSQNERMAVLQKFKSSSEINTIFLSKVGDTSIDLPEATCLIQISSHYGSRRQEAQRLGRILRAKKRNIQGFNAFFYSLVSRDTEEMYFSAKRQQFLIDQGYAFKTITRIKEIDNANGLVYSAQKEQDELLREIVLATESDAEDETLSDVDDIDAVFHSSSSYISQISGAGNMAYMETKQPRRIT